MKVSGEYYMTDNGVMVEGRVHDTAIPETRRLFNEHGPQWLQIMYAGSYGAADFVRDGEPYHMLGSSWFNRMVLMASVRNPWPISTEKINDILGNYATPPDVDVTNLMQYSGILLYPSSTSLMRISNIAAYTSTGAIRRKSANLLNVGWIFDKVQSDGSFKVELLGLVNRHIMTMMMTALTRYVKLLDSECVLNLIKDPDNLRYRRAAGVW